MPMLPGSENTPPDAPVTPPEPVSAPPAQPVEDWTPPTREQLSQFANDFMQQRSMLEQAAAYIQQLEAQMASAPQPEVEEEDFDDLSFLEPDNLRQYIEEAINQGITQAVDLHPVVQQQYEERGRQIAEASFTEFEKHMGNFDHDLALRLAQAASASGMNPQHALISGAQQAKQYADSLRTRAVEEYTNRLQDLAGAPRDPGTQGAATERPRQARSYDEVAANFSARHRLAQQALN